MHLNKWHMKDGDTSDRALCGRKTELLLWPEEFTKRLESEKCESCRRAEFSTARRCDD